MSESRLHSEITQLPVVDPHSAASAPPPPQDGQPLLEPSAPGFETIGRDLVRRREHKCVRECSVLIHQSQHQLLCRTVCLERRVVHAQFPEARFSTNQKAHFVEEFGFQPRASMFGAEFQHTDGQILQLASRVPRYARPCATPCPVLPRSANV